MHPLTQGGTRQSRSPHYTCGAIGLLSLRMAYSSDCSSAWARVRITYLKRSEISLHCVGLLVGLGPLRRSLQSQPAEDGSARITLSDRYHPCHNALFSPSLVSRQTSHGETTHLVPRALGKWRLMIGPKYMMGLSSFTTNTRGPSQWTILRAHHRTPFRSIPLNPPLNPRAHPPAHPPLPVPLTSLTSQI